MGNVGWRTTLRRTFRRGGLLFLAVSLFASLIPANTFAITDYGPDNGEFAEGRYVLANSPNTGDLSYMEIPIYYTGQTNPGTARITLYDIVRYQAQDQLIVVNGNYSAKYASDANIDVGGFSWHAATGTWRTVVSFRLVNGGNNWPSSYYQNRIAFRLDVASGYLVGNATGGASGWFNIIAADPRAGLPSINYSVQFATPCTIEANTYNTISLFDIDSGQADNEFRWISVWVTDITTGGVVPLNPSGGTGQNQAYNLGMTFQPSHKYILHINNVSHINLVQYRFPYDNASYVTGCPVTPKYTLTPSVTVTPNIAEAGASMSVNPDVANSGPTTSGDVAWELTKFIVPSGTTIPNEAGGTSSDAPCAGYYLVTGVDCSTVSSGTSRFTTSGTVSSGAALSDYAGVVDDVDVGSRICYSLMVNPYTSDSTSTPRRYSRAQCILVSKKPKVQVLGSDLYSTSSIGTSVSAKSGTLYGSWGEYLVSAVGSVSGMASARGYAGGTNQTLFCAVSYLTLTNGGTGGCTNATNKGNYTMSAALPDFSSLFAQTSSRGNNPTINVATDPGGTYAATGTVTLQATGQVPTGRSVVLYAPNADVRITDNILYANGPFSTASDIPQVVVVANSISIEGDVSRVDAWLVATGASGIINTCSDVANATDLTSKVCINQLTVNGPVVAKQLLLRRTAGSGTGAASGEPAEVFNLRPDAYMWLANRQGGVPKARTVLSTELPPRF